MAFAAPLIPLLPTILGVGSGALMGINQIQQGNYQAAVAKNNSAILERNAAAESERGQREAARSDREYAAALGEMTAGQAASGLDILGRSQVAGRNLTRRVAGEARGDITDESSGNARRLLQEAANARAEGKAAKRQGIISGVGSFLGAAGELSGSTGFTSSLATSRRRPTRSGRRHWYGN